MLLPLHPAQQRWLKFKLILKGLEIGPSEPNRNYRWAW
jgi:hypothetical protein